MSTLSFLILLQCILACIKKIKTPLAASFSLWKKEFLVPQMSLFQDQSSGGHFPKLPLVSTAKKSLTMEEEKGMNERVNSLLLVNQLDYRLAPSLSVAVSRSHASYQANQQSYGEGQNLSVTMSSGGQYVNFRESYLSFSVRVVCSLTAGEDVWAFPQWSAQELLHAGDDPRFAPARNGCMNLFASQRWVHASGTVIDEQIQDLDLWSYVRNKYTWGSDKHVSMGSLQHYGMPNDAANGLAGTPSTLKFRNGDVKQFLVPLSDISDAFDQQQLCPAFIVAGSRLELRLNEFAKAFTSTQVLAVPQVTPKYYIEKVELVLQQVQLTDSIQRALQNISASSGLEYPFTSIAVNSTNNAETSGSIQVSRALSRANSVVVVRRDAGQITGNTMWSRQSCCPSDRAIVDDVNGSYSVQLGGQQIPQSPIRTRKEAYYQAMIAFGAAFDSTKCPALPFASFHGYAAAAGVSDAVYAVSLETSSTLNQSGSALSAQRVLVFDYKQVAVGNGSSYYTMFTPHVRLVTAYLDSLIARS